MTSKYHPFPSSTKPIHSLFDLSAFNKPLPDKDNLKSLPRDQLEQLIFSRLHPENTTPTLNGHSSNSHSQPKSQSNEPNLNSGVASNGKVQDFYTFNSDLSLLPSTSSYVIKASGPDQEKSSTKSIVDPKIGVNHGLSKTAQNFDFEKSIKNGLKELYGNKSNNSTNIGQSLLDSDSAEKENMLGLLKSRSGFASKDQSLILSPDVNTQSGGNSYVLQQCKTNSVGRSGRSDTGSAGMFGAYIDIYSF